MNRQSLLSPSLRRTTAKGIEFFEELLQHAREWPPIPPRKASALVVDDDLLSNRLAVSALRHAQVEAHSASLPLEALRLLQQVHYDLVLVDIEMAGMSGFELAKRLRAIPGYLRTPVIFVTAHSDFEVRAKTIESGGDDLIAKPILPVELAAKAVMHLLKSEMLTIPAPDSQRLEAALQGQDDRAFDNEVAPPEESRSRALSLDSRVSPGRPFETAAQNRSWEFNAVKPSDGHEDNDGV